MEIKTIHICQDTFLNILFMFLDVIDARCHVRSVPFVTARQLPVSNAVLVGEAFR